MDHQLIAAVEAQHDQLQQPTCAVEPEPKLTRRTPLVQLSDVHAALRRRDGVLGSDPVFECRPMNPHYAASIHAFTAARMASDRET